MAWHYLPVFVKQDDGSETFSICEVIAADDGTMCAVTSDYMIAPYGETQAELIAVLEMMLADAKRYQAEEYDEMVSGMAFKPFEGNKEALKEMEAIAAKVKLYRLCEKFIKDHKISGIDMAIEVTADMATTELVVQIAEIVGYYEEDEE